MRRGLGLLLYGLLGLLATLGLGGGLGLGPVFLLLGEPWIAWGLLGIGVGLGVLTLGVRLGLRLPSTPYFERTLALLGLITFFWASGVWAVRELVDIDNYVGNNTPTIEEAPRRVTPTNLAAELRELYRRTRGRYGE